MQKTVWLNLDSEKVDVTYLDEQCKINGWNFIKQPIAPGDEEKTIEMGLKADAVISTWEPWNDRTLQAVKDKVKYIVRYGAGTDNIVNAGRRFTTCVGGCKKGIWPSTITGTELDGKTVGLLGFGNISRQLVRMMSGFQVNIIAYDAFVPKEDFEKFNVTPVDCKEELFKRSDIISLHVPFNEETSKMVNSEMFDLMKELSDILREKRRKRGSIDFDFPESKVILDENGKPIEIKPYERNAATKLIEDFMLLANETVAEDYFWQDLPFVYRTHDYPDPEKMKRLGTFINNFGYTIKTQQGEVHPKELQKLLEKIEGTTEEALISRLTLRSMKQAKYMPVCIGHFGLAAKYYTHFTSPIRRYPDLQIHRIIKENMRGGLSEKRIAHYDKILQGVTVQCSAMERRADEAERETLKLKKCEYMSRHIGEEFEGVISGVTNWGFYVELPNTVEGLVHVNDLHGDYYAFDEERMELIGELSRKTYKLGQKIWVTVTGTDKLAKTIDFIPAKRETEEVE